MARIRLVHGDITALEVGAIVNAANDHLWMGAGVAGAIKRVGGEEIEREATAQGPIQVGSAVATGAGRLRARYIIHAAVMGQDLRTDAGKIQRATASALEVARALGVRSVALPALGTGVGGFPLPECARLMLDEAERHLLEGSTLDEVVLALRGDDAMAAFREALGGDEKEAAGPRRCRAAPRLPGEALPPGRPSGERTVR